MTGGFFHEAPRALLAASAPSFRLPKKSRHSASTDVGIGLVAGVEVFDVGGVAAVEKGGECESRVRVLA